MIANPLGIHCRECSTADPCVRCARQIRAEQNYADGWLGRDWMCDQCGGSGWLCGQSYGYSWPAEVRDDEMAEPIQRCDTCERWEGDWDAARACLAMDFDGDGVVVWGVHDDPFFTEFPDHEDAPPLDVFLITVKENL
jgi:hypothetical protein